MSKEIRSEDTGDFEGDQGRNTTGNREPVAGATKDKESSPAAKVSAGTNEDHTAPVVNPYEERLLNFLMLRSKQEPFDESSPPLVLDVPVAGKKCWSAMDAVKPTFVAGETGSGKTIGVVKPMARAYIRYRNEDGMKAGVVVIDPKGDLLPFIMRELSQTSELARLTIIGETPAPLDYFEFFDDKVSSAERVDILVNEFVPAETASGASDQWRLMAQSFLKDVAVAQEEFQKSFPGAEFALSDYVILSGCYETLDMTSVENFLTQVSASVAACPPSIYPLLKSMRQAPDFFSASRRLLDFLISGQTASSTHKWLRSDEQRFQRRVRELYDLLSRESSAPFGNPLAFFSSDTKQPGYYLQMLSPLFSIVTNAALQKMVHLDPFKPPRTEPLSFRAEMEAGRVLTYSPNTIESGNDVVVGNTLKSLLAEYLRNRSNPRLVTCYVADEFHKYMTVEGSASEAQIFSWGRSFRLMVTVATQSVAALNTRAEALGCRGSNSPVKAMLFNTPNKVFFRTSDQETQATVEAYAGARAGTVHVPSRVALTPVYKLKVGASYYLAGGNALGFQPPMSEAMAREFGVGVVGN